MGRRYRPDRAFPPYRFVPGTKPHPTRDPGGHSYGTEAEAVHVPPERWKEDDDYLFGVDLYHAAYFWEAHEVWEGIWKASPEPMQREFLQGLIQLAASYLKEGRGKDELQSRARERLKGLPDEYMGLDVGELLAADWGTPPVLELTADS